MKRGNQSSVGSTSKKLKYVNDSSHVWFKSNKGNGSSWLSNFWPSGCNTKNVPPFILESKASFDVDGIVYPTVEHYFQSAKYSMRGDDLGKKIAQDIRKQPTALAAKKRNTHWKHNSPCDMDLWNDQRIGVMRTAIRGKFTQNAPLGRALVQLCDGKTIAEVGGRGADFWAGSEGMLGILLMELRDDLKKDSRFSSEGE